MTPEEIDKLEAGRYTDVKVHQDVMGFGAFSAKLGTAEGINQSTEQGDALDLDPHLLSIIPNYTTEDGAAMQVVLRVADSRRWKVTLTGRRKSGRGVAPDVWTATVAKDNLLIAEATADTRPLAICRATLKAAHFGE